MQNNLFKPKVYKDKNKDLSAMKSSQAVSLYESQIMLDSYANKHMGEHNQNFIV